MSNNKIKSGKSNDVLFNMDGISCRRRNVCKLKKKSRRNEKNMLHELKTVYLNTPKLQ